MPTPIPTAYPSWCSWHSGEPYLPKEFHSRSSLKKILEILHSTLKDPSVLKGGKVDAPLLLLGLTYREVSRAAEFEPGTSSKSTVHLENSPFLIKDLDAILDLITEIKLPSSQ
jgi:hypothetical protein